MALKRIVRESASKQVFDQIRQMILSGEWKPGDRILSETELSTLFHVSRVTVRQALQKLSTMGLIETRWGEGNFVKAMNVGHVANELVSAIYLSDDAIRNVWEFRLITEVEGTFLAAQRATGEDIEALQANFEKMLSYPENSDMFLMADFEFHQMITGITGNPILVQAQSILKEVLLDSILKLTKAVGKNEGAIYHRKILDAIEHSDPHKSRDLMRQHLQHAYLLYENFLRDQSS